MALILALAFGACANSDEHALCIRTLGGETFEFEVELADSPEARRIGLMHRTELAEDAGMLFDFDQEQPIAMWMKNTPLSLDMVFIGTGGRIQRIATNTEPLSLTRIASGRPARAVLEVPAGTSKRLGISVGDHVLHPIFGDSCDAG